MIRGKRMAERIRVHVEGGGGRRRGGLGRWLIMAPGLGCIAMGVLAIVLPPRVTATVVAVFFFIVGAGLLSIAARLRRWWTQNVGP